jgi:(1->4)-alpha-D-glucan 1-alpha-D-glucosylmutase
MQFQADWRFEDARRLVPYLHALGVTHLYSSPILKARAGSTHGYDIVDHNAINPEIGTEDDFRALVRDLKAAGMGVLLDIVPNHMGVGYGTNPWWQDVLENGRASAFAEFFDIDWEPLKPELHGKVLLPVLGSPYGEELEQGRIQVRWDADGCRVQYYDKNFAVDPQTFGLVFGPDLPPAAEPDLQRLAELLSDLRNLPARDVGDAALVARRREQAPRLKAALKDLWERSPAVQEAVRQATIRINGRPGDPESFHDLHRLLEAQAYRLAHWVVSAEEINYRRFFDINDLVGLRMENPEVFAATHRLIRRLLAEGGIDGLRVDHPDGLFNPVQYFTRLQTLYAAARCCGPEPQGEVGENGIELELQSAFAQWESAPRPPLLSVLVEKILEAGESLPADWAVDGTVGYEFGVLLNNLFLDSRNRRAFTNLYHRFIGGALDADSVIYESKKLILHTALASEVAVLTHRLQEISNSDRYARDFTRKMLSDAIREVIACFPVYRTYVDARGNVSERDRAAIVEAVARAKHRNEIMASAVFDYLRDILLLKESPRSLDLSRKQLYFTMKFQQLTGPAMAKGLEDTACYVDNRLVSVNEVGGSPAQFGTSVEEFHRAGQVRAERWPFQLLETSTHDSKRSEDVRARLNLLSEMPKLWSANVMRWRRANRTRKRIISDGRTVPDANEEYLLYQTLVGTWPWRLDSPEERGRYLRRIQQYMNKAVHEAKVNLSWTNPNPEYIQALEQFIAKILQPGKRTRPNTFLQQMEAFLPPVFFFGAIASLAQLLLKATAPGVPGLYQGNEFFDFSLVDPDNRRPVDYSVRECALQELLAEVHAGDRRRLCERLLAQYQDGRLKMWTTLQALRFRREHADLFRHGRYLPLEASGEGRDHVVAFAREHLGDAAVVVVPRFAYTLMKGEPAHPFAEAWQDTRVMLPGSLPLRWENVFTGEACEIPDAGARSLSCGDLFRVFPVALLKTV